jgi:hypothetical protein
MQEKKSMKGEKHMKERSTEGKRKDMERRKYFEKYVTIQISKHVNLSRFPVKTLTLSTLSGIQ